MNPADTRYMRLAISLSRRGLGQCWPRPNVGCVLVHDNRIVGRGFTQPEGAHAERVALDQAGGLARGSVAYVTLEPCAHHGRTPPCSDALIAAGVRKVIAAVQDPDPRVQGKGFAKLREAGVEVETGLFAQQAQEALNGFLYRVDCGRPWVTLKLATSLDGRIATASGHSQWITGPEARRHVHGQRARFDAVMVGAGTVRADDPMLTVRDMGPVQQPVRIVVSRRLDLPLMSQLARTAKDVPVWLCHGPDADTALIEAWRSLGATLLPCALSGRQLDVRSVMQELGKSGLTRVFCEGGGALAASLLSDRQVDEFIGYTAGTAIGAEGLPGISALGLDRLDDAARFQLVETRAIGQDIMHRWLA